MTKETVTAMILALLATRSIKCTCPKEFDYIEYDIPRHDWTLFVDGKTQIEIDTSVVTNTCNPDTGGMVRWSHLTIPPVLRAQMGVLICLSHHR